MNDKQCRFCLTSEDGNANPLIAPCNCRGSQEFVHVECIRKWRAYTTESKHKRTCHVCNTDWLILYRWPMETIPTYTGNTLLEKPWFISLFGNYVYFQMLLYLSESSPEVPREVHVANYAYSQNGYYLYYSIYGTITGLYFIHYLYLFKDVKNKCMYLYTWTNPLLNTPYIPPFYLFIFSIAMMGLTFLTPFGFVYLATLPMYMVIHKRILITMNENAEMI